MRPGWRVGSIFGIPLLVDFSWFLILAMVTVSYVGDFQRRGFAFEISVVTGLFAALALFTSVLLHELGHSLVARSQGIKVNSITLFLFGGIASIDEESKTPAQAMRVAIAGPSVSLVLSLLLWAVGLALPSASPAQIVVENLMVLNLVLALFNMIPGLPLDGGQVLKAVVWKVSGSRIKGQRWAARAGLFWGWAAIFLGVSLYFQFRGSAFAALWIAFIGWFIVSNARTYSRVADLQDAVLEIKAADAMVRDFRVVDAHLPLQKFIDDYWMKEEGVPPAFFITSDGRYRGQIEPDELQQVERSLWQIQTLQEFAHPLTSIPTVVETTAIAEVIDKLEIQELRRITVLSPAGTVAGTVDRGDIVRAVAQKLQVPIPETFIQQIKEAGAYPPGLPLAAIAKAAGDGGKG